jgi:protein O-GlcNAc transferase
MINSRAAPAVIAAEETSKPGALEAQLKVGLEHQRSGRLEAAEAIYIDVLRVEPRHPHALNLLGLLNNLLGRNAIALAFLRKAIAIDPQISAFHTNLGNLLHGQGLLDESLAAYRAALAISPESVRAHSNLLVALHYLPDYSREALAGDAREWGSRHALPLAATHRPHANRPEPERRLRIGYVSGELFRHPVSYFFESLLLAHDRDQVETTCYSTNPRCDDVTDRLRIASDRWQSVVGLSDAQTADVIRADGIDILIDLSGHLGDHRLLTFARKPAPLQATWMGYFDTTGVAAIDYLIGDNVVCPAGEDGLYVEQVMRLPGCYMCYRPPEFAPAVTALPALTREPVVFGCFNRLAKITPRVLSTWAEILHAVPCSQLALKGSNIDDPSTHARLTSFFREHRLDPSRVRLMGPSPQPEFLAAYGDVDIALDTFPYSGSTTSAEALWMGVPVVTLRGDRFVARTSETILRAAGLDDLVAASTHDYVSTAVALAEDRARLAALRMELRPRVARSGLCDGPRFARAMEAAYRCMWRRWCRIT